MPVALSRAIVARRHASGAVLAAGLLCVLLDQPVGVALVAAALAALAVMPDRRRRTAWLPDLLAWLPVGLAVAMSLGVLVVIVSGLAGVRLWGGLAGSVSAAAFIAVLGTIGLVRGGRVALWSVGSVVAWIPGLVLVIAAVFRFSQPMSYWSRPVWAVTDWMNHAEMVADLMRNRLLDYDPASSSAGWVKTVYPRGLHALLAWLSGAEGGALETWQTAIQAVAVAVAVLAAATVVAAALLAFGAAVRLRLPGWLALVVSMITALLMLHPGVNQAMACAGFLTTAGAALVSIAAVMVGTSGPAARVSWTRVAVSALLTVGMFHLWQLLAIPLGLLTAHLAWRWWTSRRDQPWIVGGVLVGAGLACIPLAGATLGITELDGQGLNGGYVGMSVIVALVIAAMALGTLAWRRRLLAALTASAAVPITAMLVVGVAMVPASGGTITDVPYYAQKVLWHAGVLGLPIAIAGAAAAVTVIVRRAAARLPGSPVTRGAVIAVPLVLLLAYLGGGLSYGVGQTLRSLGAAGGLSPQVPLAILDVPGLLDDPGRAVLPLSLHPRGWGPSFLFTDWHAAQVVRYLGADVPAEGTLSSHRLGSVCTWLRAHPDAIRVTGPTLGFRELLDDGCPADVVRPDDWVVVTPPPEWWAT